MDISFGVYANEAFLQGLRTAVRGKNGGTGGGIMKPVFQDIPVEDGVRLPTPHGKRRDS
jgi:hypothetical protein